MAVAQRLVLINKAKTRMGRKGQNLNLVNAYDGVTRYMSVKYPLIAHLRATGPAVIGQNYLAHSALTPVNATYVLANLRAVEKVQYNAVDLEYLEPELFFTFYSASNAVPTKATHTWIDGAAANAKVWLYPPPDGVLTVTLYYSIVQIKSTGDTYQHLMTEEMDEAIIRGICWKGCEIIGEFQKALWWKQLFEKELMEKSAEKIKRFQLVHNPEF